MKEEFLEVFIKTVVPILATALAGLVGYLGTLLGTWLKAKGQESKLANAGSLVLTHVTTAVHNIEGGMKAEYEKAAADGVITAEEGAALKQAAINMTLATLGDTGKKAMTDVLKVSAEAIPAFLAGQVEKVVATVGKVPEVPAPVPVALPLAVLPGGLPLP